MIFLNGNSSSGYRLLRGKIESEKIVNSHEHKKIDTKSPLF